MLSSVLYLLFTSTSVEAHSWIQCTDYRGDTGNYQGNQCFGHVRPWQRGQNDMVSPNQVGFGVDQGMNKLLREGPDGQCNTLVDNQFAAGNFPMANYKRGQTVTLAWPAKNHVPETCDGNPGGANLPDTRNELFMERSVPGLRINYDREVVFEPMTKGNTHVQGQIDYKGFGKCPKFCENRDKALCTGRFVVPDVPDGKYSFSWRWEFNRGETYVTCFDAMVQGDEIKPETGNKWDEGGIGMFVERGNGCNDHLSEDKCLSYADGRDDRVGERCAWCCGENCNQQGGPGGDNKCEPIPFLTEHGINRWRSAGQDNCNPPTVAPSPEPTIQPTETPTRNPTTQLIAPNPGSSPNRPNRGRDGSNSGAPNFPFPQTGMGGEIDIEWDFPGMDGAGIPLLNCAPLMGQCGGEGAMTNCCMEGECVVVSPFVSQCQPKKSSGGVSTTTVLICVAVAFVAALICGSVLVYMKISSGGSSSTDAYYKHSSMSDRDTRGRYDDRHDRTRRKKKKSRSREDSRERSRDRSHKKERRTRRDSLSPKRTSSNGSWVEDN